MAKLSFKHLSTILLAISLLIVLFSVLTKPVSKSFNHPNIQQDTDCKGIHRNNPTRQQKCSYVRSNNGCKPNAYLPSLELFYCAFTIPSLGYITLFLWLFVLFYLLGDTTSSYFCHLLSGLSESLKLSPTISGVTLLSLGNGAPDVFASVIAFMGHGSEDLGMNSILGGGIFVTGVVFGIICICVDKSDVKIGRKAFFANFVFLLVSLSFLALFVKIRHIGIWGGVSLLSLYVIYVIFVFTKVREDHGVPIEGSHGSENNPDSDDQMMPVSRPESISTDPAEPQNSRFNDVRVSTCLDIILWLLELPLDLPRKLTIPVVSARKWEKPYAVISTTLAPITLSLASSIFTNRKSVILDFAISGPIGVSLGTLLFFTSDRVTPPKRGVSIWVILGFAMSITWTYFLARELVSLLVSLSVIVGISHTLIGLTVLAWGNSVGDLIANVAMARKGGSDGVRVATTGCFAGPLFSILVGLGLSLGISALKTYPKPYTISVGNSIWVTLGFYALGLLWTFVVVLKGEMRIGKCLGFGLMAIYLCFLCEQIVVGLGVVRLPLSM